MGWLWGTGQEVILEEYYRTGIDFKDLELKGLD
jgi:hypothetical protein